VINLDRTSETFVNLQEKIMKFLKSFLMLLGILASLAFAAQPSFADQPSPSENPDYIEITKTLNSLLSDKDEQVATGKSVTQELEQKIDALAFQKYTLETGLNWGQCRNETGNTLAIYGPKPDEDDYEDYPYDNAVYFLAAGQTTKNGWDCDGIYISSDAKAPSLTTEDGQKLAGSGAVKIVDGTKLVIKANPSTGALEFNVPPAQVLKTEAANWFIPNVPQAEINARVANAPIAKIPQPNVLAANSPDQGKARIFPQQPLQQSLPQFQSQPSPPNAGVYGRH
jgi:hypothetical protein